MRETPLETLRRYVTEGRIDFLRGRALEELLKEVAACRVAATIPLPPPPPGAVFDEPGMTIRLDLKRDQCAHPSHDERTGGHCDSEVSRSGLDKVKGGRDAQDKREIIKLHDRD